MHGCAILPLQLSSEAICSVRQPFWAQSVGQNARGFARVDQNSIIITTFAPARAEDDRESPGIVRSRV